MKYFRLCQLIFTCSVLSSVSVGDSPVLCMCKNLKNNILTAGTAGSLISSINFHSAANDSVPIYNSTLPTAGMLMC